ncbi:hypothetical protein BJ912DRAFT_286246 [Pholiota molesta]|nr:hypothetical protein BJ912DRAFT_286246 [Pholiota molesta]
MFIASLSLTFPFSRPPLTLPKTTICMSSSSTENPERKASNAKKTMNLSAANVGIVRRIADRKTLTPRRNTKRAGTTSRSSVPLNDNAPMASMFGDNTEIFGGQFIIAETVNNVKPSRAEDGFKLLQKRVATSAFHNSAQRVDPPRCHPETRKEILKRIYDWITQSAAREKWLLWLNGAAGAGKSAIMQSIAEKCAVAAIALASFFFFRGDHTRNTIAPLVATLAYQLIQAIPEIADHILLTVERNPLIFDQTLESQLQHLIILPLLRLPRELQRLFVVFIDGLDECSNQVHQANLVKVLGDVSCRRNIPVVFLVASRREPQIEAAFVQKSVSDLLFTLPLDNSGVEQTFNDILRFLNDRFEDTIKDTHLYKDFCIRRYQLYIFTP